MAEGLEIRIAHLEGAYEQFDKRLATVETRLGGVEAEVRALRSELLGRIDGVQGRIDGVQGRIDNVRIELEGRMDSHFHWILGFQIATLLSLIGTLLAVLLRQ